ncbi:alanine--glyoxylate aminotransferase family protein [Methanonatronarchaeum sp. AMET-Sl]|uniref:pyridoxal-phosphate-dependent aminotransferase family protein n=1 Tax=Methanonatronarchaeum sp. AMET-Sl TaxID=3037654 RepID=UPI00244E21AB|nr:alanine--glyoxylate aminotransferase family protein [Methanonatronarchaeum sp. AMET-Sl]WGI16668.1 alanine--glyoxylate aminotransferase family protein [Methanonatronarchaeum sp. AMET-Sl]
MELLMTAGPTEIPPRVRAAMNRRIQSPDFDDRFKVFYKNLEKKLQKVLKTDKDTLILGGEGILGLEASISSIVDEEDDVLCISNGFFGDGFADFVKMRGAKPELITQPYNQAIDIEKVKNSLEKNDYKAATIVHCETPTGILNNLDRLLPLIKDSGALTIVDAVSSLAGTPVPTDIIDICIGGSQKCLSTPPGLTTVTLSDRAWEAIDEHKQDTYYTSLKPWKDIWQKSNKFPYSHLVTNLYALDESLNLIMEEGIENVYKRHKKSQKTCIEMCRENGLEFYPKNPETMSPTVTAIQMNGKAKKIQKTVQKESNILLSTGLGELENDIIRVGHMGYNADPHKVRRTVNAIKKAK